jgi:hypothetical protein
MKRKHQNAEQLLKQGQTVADVCRALEVSAATYHQFPLLLCDLGQHPLARHGDQTLQIQPFKQVEAGGVAGCAAKTESRVEGLVVSGAKGLGLVH